MKRLQTVLLGILVFAGCYKGNPPCNPSTVDWPRCDPTQPAMPKMGSSLLYPGRGTTAIGISDSTAAGRALLTAASAAAQRAALGISDVTEEASNELVHANTVCAFTLPSVLVTFPALAKPGAAGSAWAQTAGSGTAAITRVASGIRGGALQLTTGASGGEIDLAAGPVADAAFGGSFVDDLVAATSKWHVEYVAKITSTPGATTEWGLGWISPPGLIGPMMGVRGAQSTAKFRMFQGNTATGVNSTINIDTNWHRFRMWANGDTLIYFSVDNETPVTLSTTWGAAASPFAWLVQASSSQTVLLAGARYRVDGVVQ